MPHQVKKKGFSLLEIIIALGVIAVISGLGYSGLISFRSTTQMQNVYSEFVSNLRLLQNKAKNSINTSTTNDSAPAIYVVVIGNDNYTFYNCVKTSTFSTNVQCSIDDSVAKKDIPATIKITPEPSCVGLGFAKLTGKIVSINMANAGGATPATLSTNFNTTGTCKIVITSTVISSTKTIKISFDSGTIDL